MSRPDLTFCSVSCEVILLFYFNQQAVKNWVKLTQDIVYMYKQNFLYSTDVWSFHVLFNKLYEIELTLFMI